MKTYSLDETVIEQGGALRCCIGTVATEFKDKKVKIGDTSICHHCAEKFTLVDPASVKTTCYSKLTKPIWKPDWQLTPHFHSTSGGKNE